MSSPSLAGWMCFTDGLDRRRDWRWLFLAGASGAHHRAPAAGNRLSARLEEGLCTADGESWTVSNPRCHAQEIRAWGIPDPVVRGTELYCTWRRSWGALHVGRTCEQLALIGSLSRPSTSHSLANATQKAEPTIILSLPCGVASLNT
jgi:hypothetical protein